MANKQVGPALLWPAVDVGGTSIRVLLVADSDLPRPAAPIRLEVPTPRGLSALGETIRSCLRRVTEMAAGCGHPVAEALAIGTPGRLVTGAEGRPVIAPQSATNLEAFPGEFDEIDLAAELADALGLPRSKVFWDNDAILQGRQVIRELLRESETARLIRGHTVVCINPGTGLGGCVAWVNDNSIDVFTDGHVSELLIHPVEATADLGPIAVAVRSSIDASTIQMETRSGSSEVSELLPSPNWKQAENYISGSGLARIAVAIEACCARLSPPLSCFEAGDGGVDGRVLSDLIDLPAGSTAARAARFVGDLGGLALARLMTVLHNGSAVKSAPFPNWSSTDLDRIRGVTRFVLGGGITRTPLGRRMISAARSHLTTWPELEIFEREQVDDAGALGAFSLIPAAVRRAEEAER